MLSHLMIPSIRAGLKSLLVFRVHTGHGKPGKSRKIKISKSWPGKRGKLVLVIESHGKLDFFWIIE